MAIVTSRPSAGRRFFRSTYLTGPCPNGCKSDKFASHQVSEESENCDFQKAGTPKFHFYAQCNIYFLCLFVAALSHVSCSEVAICYACVAFAFATIKVMKTYIGPTHSWMGLLA